MEKKHKRLIGYCRVSTDNQKEEGTIEIQCQALREYAESKGYVLVDIFCDEGQGALRTGRASQRFLIALKQTLAWAVCSYSS